MRSILPISIALIGLGQAVAAVTGKIVDEQGKPIFGVNLNYSTGGIVKASTESDSLGNFSLVYGQLPVENTSNYAIAVDADKINLDLANTQTVQLTLINAQGHHAELFSGSLQGKRSFAIQSRAGWNWLRVQIGNQTRMIHLDPNHSNTIRQNMMALSLLDSMRVKKNGYFVQQFAMSSRDTNVGTLVLKKPTEWDSVSHSSKAGIDANLLFPDNKVNRIDVKITTTNWKALMDDMTVRYGTLRPRKADSRLYISPLSKGTPVSENPIFVPVTVQFNGKTWNHVGLRFKGNATLSGSWSGSPLHLPFKLDFDEYENEHPEIHDQRFYGVKQFSNYNHKSDDSFLREKLLGGLYKDANVAVPRRGYYEVYFDFGIGSQYMGLYTFVESPYNQTMKDLFGYSGDLEGNIYKPEGPMDTTLRKSAQLRPGSPMNQVTFEKQNNYDDKATPMGDWSDAQALIDLASSSKRTSAPTTWRSELESKFNVDSFLRWLAVNTVFGSFDAYGQAPHNYFLYNNPATGKLNWVAYDLNFSLANPTTGSSMYVPFDQSSVTSEWPLIRNLIDDPVYNALYWQKLRDFNATFDPNKINSRIDQLWTLIEPSLLKEQTNFCNFPCYTDSPTWYSGYKDELKSTMTTRKNQLNSALAAHPAP